MEFSELNIELIFDHCPEEVQWITINKFGNMMFHVEEPIIDGRKKIWKSEGKEYFEYHLTKGNPINIEGKNWKKLIWGKPVSYIGCLGYFWHGDFNKSHISELQDFNRLHNCPYTDIENKNWPNFKPMKKKELSKYVDIAPK